MIAFLESNHLVGVKLPCMPTNVTAEYKKAEDAFRKAREPRERLEDEVGVGIAGAKPSLCALEGLDQEVSVMLNAVRNSEIDAAGENSKVTVRCQILEWDTLYDRPSFYEV